MMADKLARIREKMANKLRATEKVCTFWEQADRILSLTVSSGGGACPKCYRGGILLNSKKFGPAASYPCPKCNGTGQLKVVGKTIGEIISNDLR